MIHKIFRKSGAFFILLPFAFWMFACAWTQPEQQGDRLIGGPCRYKSYPGRATILSITESRNADQAEIIRFNVKFSFTPQQPVQEKYVHAEGWAFDLYGHDFQYPDREFLKKHNIHAGKVIDGIMQVIVSGTCTPVLFDFPGLRPEK
ncbi:MAG: hypothetical protein K4571_19145 [Deltaproteobacteria bacterium]